MIAVKTAGLLPWQHFVDDTLSGSIMIAVKGGGPRSEKLET